MLGWPASPCFKDRIGRVVIGSCWLRLISSQVRCGRGGSGMPSPSVYSTKVAMHWPGVVHTERTPAPHETTYNPLPVASVPRAVPSRREGDWGQRSTGAPRLYVPVRAAREGDAYGASGVDSGAPPGAMCLIGPECSRNVQKGLAHVPHRHDRRSRQGRAAGRPAARGGRPRGRLPHPQP